MLKRERNGSTYTSAIHQPPGLAAVWLQPDAGTQFDPAVVDAALVVIARDQDLPAVLTGGGNAA